jgi:hypothetical protein
MLANIFFTTFWLLTMFLRVCKLNQSLVFGMQICGCKFCVGSQFSGTYKVHLWSLNHMKLSGKNWVLHSGTTKFKQNGQVIVQESSGLKINVTDWIVSSLKVTKKCTQQRGKRKDKKRGPKSKPEAPKPKVGQRRPRNKLCSKTRTSHNSISENERESKLQNWL